MPFSGGGGGTGPQGPKGDDGAQGAAGNMGSWTYVYLNDAGTYKAYNGQTGALAASNAVFDTLLNGLWADHTSHKFRPGTYYSTVHDGIDLNTHHSVSLIGDEGVVFKKNEAAGVTGQVMQVMACTDITIDSIIFDQDHSNPNHQHETDFGYQWVWREGNTSNNIWVRNCKFINGLGCGIVTGDSHHVHFVNCEVNWCGEHPWYFYQTDWLYMERCRTYSWAKLCRGYGPKLDTCLHYYASNNEWFGNKDGTGPASSGGPSPPEYGIYGPVVAHSDDVHFTDDDFLGDGTGTDQMIAWQLHYGNRVYFTGCKFFDTGTIEFEDWTCTDIEMNTCYIEMDHYAGSNQVCFQKLINCTIVDPKILYCHADNAVVEGCTLRWVDRTKDFVLTNFNSHANPLFNHNKVIGLDVYGPYFAGSTDGQCIGNVFPSGITVDWLGWGTRTRVENNVNYVTRSCGVTSVADGGTISHTLITTPTRVNATPVTSGEFVSVTAKGTTTFTVAIKKHDNSAGTTQNVYWEAEYQG